MNDVEDFTKRCNDPEKLNVLVRTLLLMAMEEVAAVKVKAVIFETYRSQTRQNWIYCGGRTVAECVKAGIPKAFAEKWADPSDGENTWTLRSKHKTGKAVDVVPYIKGKLTWSHEAAEQLAIVGIMSKYGFECGTNWTKNRDSCHYQIDGNFTSYFDAKHTTPYVTAAIQAALNKKIDAHLVVDGKWGPLTTAAVNEFRKRRKYKVNVGQLGATALKALFS